MAVDTVTEVTASVTEVTEVVMAVIQVNFKKNVEAHN